MIVKCDKGGPDGVCCCNCKNHIEDFHHCMTVKEKHDGCVCSKHKGWICLISFEGEKPRAHSNWLEHGYCELHIPEKLNV